MSIKLRFNLSLIIVILLLLMEGCSSVARMPATVTAKDIPPSGNGFDSVTYYTVVKGDTLASIARRYGCSYQDIAQWNGISPPYIIHPGQQLRVLSTVSSAAVNLSNEQDKKLKTVDYAENEVPSSSNNRFDSVTYYTVVEGDTLASIGRRYGYSYQNIIQWNGLSPPYTIHPGQQLRILPTVSSAAVNPSNENFYPKNEVERNTGGTRTKNTLEIPLKEQNGIYMLPVKINGAVTVDFVLDTGASEVAIPADVFFTLLRTGTIEERDLLESSKALLADGSVKEYERVLLRELEVGGHKIDNIECSIMPNLMSDLLLGQSFLRKLGNYSLDNDRHVLILKH